MVTKTMVNFCNKTAKIIFSAMGNILALLKDMFLALWLQRSDPAHFSVFWIWSTDPAFTFQVSKYLILNYFFMFNIFISQRYFSENIACLLW